MTWHDGAGPGLKKTPDLGLKRFSLNAFLSLFQAAAWMVVAVSNFVYSQRKLSGPTLSIPSHDGKGMGPGLFKCFNAFLWNRMMRGHRTGFNNHYHYLSSRHSMPWQDGSGRVQHKSSGHVPVYTIACERDGL